MSLLVLLMLLSNVNSTAAKSSTSSKSNVKSLPIYSCHDQTNSVKDDDSPSILPTWITYSKDTQDNIGIIQTPNFPNHFPLPLRCVWIFNNTAKLSEKDATSLFIYFTRVNEALHFSTFYLHVYWHMLFINPVYKSCFDFQYYFYDPGGNNGILTIHELDGKWPHGDENQCLSMNQIRSL